MSHTFEYKGYNGSVLYSAEDKTLHGRIIGIRDMVTYEGKNVSSLEKNFKAAVDEYLKFCKAEGKTPDTPYKGSFNVRLGTDLHKRAAHFFRAALFKRTQDDALPIRAHVKIFYFGKATDHRFG